MVERIHVIGSFAIGTVAAIGACTGNLDPSVQLENGQTVASWQMSVGANVQAVHKPNPYKLPLALVAFAAFAACIPLSEQLDDEEEDRALERNFERGMKEGKLRITGEKIFEAHELIAEEVGEEYYLNNSRGGRMPLPQTVDTTATAVAQAQPASAIAPQPQPVDNAIPTIPVQPVAQPQWTQAPQAAPQPQVQGCPILEEIVTSQRSTVNAAPTGTGKSVSRSYVLTRFAQVFPEGEIFVISQKNDSFNGLRDAGRVKLFDPMQPQDSLLLIKEVFQIFDARRKAPEQERGDFKRKPVRLLVDDWHAIFNTIQNSPFYKNEIQPMLSTLVTVGREMNVCLWIDTQSYNIKSLGLAADANIRLNLNVLCQGFTFIDEHGQLQGDYAMISNLLSNQYLVPEGEREILKQQYEQLKVQSKQQNTPVIFTTAGRARLALVPDLRAYKPGLLPAQPTQVQPQQQSGDIYDLVNQRRAA